MRFCVSVEVNDVNLSGQPYSLSFTTSQPHSLTALQPRHHTLVTGIFFSLVSTKSIQVSFN